MKKSGKAYVVRIYLKNDSGEVYDAKFVGEGKDNLVQYITEAKHFTSDKARIIADKYDKLAAYESSVRPDLSMW